MFYVIHNNAAHTCQRRRGTMANTSCWNQSVVNTMLNIHNLNESRIYIRAGCMCTHCMRSYCWQRPQVEGRQEHEIRGRERERELPSFGIGESLGLNFTKKKCQARQKLTRKSKLSTGGSSQRRGHRKTGTWTAELHARLAHLSQVPTETQLEEWGHFNVLIVYWCRQFACGAMWWTPDTNNGYQLVKIRFPVREV